MAIRRQVIKIDEEKCDGCGLCVNACHEGAIQQIDGKARLVSESYCDGLGACLGECPQGAITIEERVAEAFDQEAVERHLATQKAPAAPQPAAKPVFQCPGSMARQFSRPQAAPTGQTAQPSQLANWPVQLNLVPVHAPHFQDAHLLIAADCAPFAFADFHSRLLAGKVLLIGCPKLDNTQFYLEKLTEIFRANDIQSIEVAYMEVPCCMGLVRVVEKAVEQSGKGIPVALTEIGIQGGMERVREAATAV